MRLFVVSGVSTESVHKRTAVFVGSSDRSEKWMVSSITLDDMYSPFWRPRSALARGSSLESGYFHEVRLSDSSVEAPGQM